MKNKKRQKTKDKRQKDQFVKIRAVPASGVPARLWRGNSWTVFSKSHFLP